MEEHFGADMTDEEYDALDELLTRTTPKLTGIPGVFATQRALLNGLDTIAAACETALPAPRIPRFSET